MNKIIFHKSNLIISIISFFIAFTPKLAICQKPDYVIYDDYDILDSVYLEVLYETYKSMGTGNNSPIIEEIQILQIGKNISKNFNYTKYQNDSLTVECLKRNEPYPGNSLYVTSYEIYKNFKTRKIELIDVIRSETFLYEEEISQFNWQILNDKKLILDYTCQKAVTEFRGRKYEAWFTLDIPISDGPYKFTGLPGLILEIYDTQKQYQFKCIGIKQNFFMKPLVKRKGEKISVITKKKYVSLYKQHCDDPFWLMYRSGFSVKVNDNGVETVNPTDYKLLYNPIERE